MNRVLASLVIWLACGSAHAAEVDFFRIISLAPHATELVALLAAERLIAVDEASDFPPAILHLPKVKNYPAPNIEAILALKPDLVVTWDQPEQVRSLAKLEKLGIKVLSIQPTTPMDVAAGLRQLGNLLKLEAKAESAALAIEQRYSAVLLANRKRQPVKVFMQLGSTPILTASSRSFLGQAIETCGGINIFANQRAVVPQISVEAVLALQPDQIISTDSINALQHWHRYKQLPAVRNGQLHAINSDLLLRPGPRLVDGIELLCLVIDQARAAKIP